MQAKNYFPSVAELTAGGPEQAALHRRAGDATRSQFGREVFVRAVVEVSNFCRENCAYCGMRRDHRDLKRFRARAHRFYSYIVVLEEFHDAFTL